MKPGRISRGFIDGGPGGAPDGMVFGQSGQIIKEMVASAAINPGDAVVEDFANGINRVTKVAANDSARRFGIAISSAAAAADPVWVVVEGVVQAIAGAAIAAGAVVATSANAAGQVKTTAASAATTILGTAIGAPGAAADKFLMYVQKA